MARIYSATVQTTFKVMGEPGFCIWVVLADTIEAAETAVRASIPETFSILSIRPTEFTDETKAALKLPLGQPYML